MSESQSERHARLKNEGFMTREEFRKKFPPSKKEKAGTKSKWSEDKADEYLAQGFDKNGCGKGIRRLSDEEMDW